MDVRSLTVRLGGGNDAPSVLDRVSFALEAGEIVGLVGESGAGKSMTGAAIIGLLEHPLTKTSGEIWLAGTRIDNLSESAMLAVRGSKIGMVFQDPATSLNPVLTIGHQLTETIRQHEAIGRGEARDRAIGLLSDVGIPSPAERLGSYPHEFSGGMRQRVVIALALAGNPDLIIADEPTTALDVSIQAQIIALLQEVASKRGAGVLLITHDLGVIAEIADRVAVMYSGRIVEIASVASIIEAPHHPYTKALMRSIPVVGDRRGRLPQIAGAMPRVGARPQGCAFHPRCTSRLDRCDADRPELEAKQDAQVACWAV
ncbi:MAG: ABC transporter ATP-binding protein [Pseudomonadota bacterium]